MSKSQLAKTKVAFGFGLVGLSGMFVNQALFWFFHDVMSFWISWRQSLPPRDRRSGTLS